MALSTTIRDLHRRKARERRELALAEGVRLVEEMLTSGVVCKGAVVAPALDGTPRGARLHRDLEQRGITIDLVTDQALLELAATEHPQGVVAVYQPKVWSLPECGPKLRHPLVILDGVQDPGNVGTIARTAVAFGASGLIALPGTADLTNPKTVRSAMGALFQLPHCHADDQAVFTMLLQCRAEVWALDMSGEALGTVTPAAPLAMIFGNEGHGVRADLLPRATRRVTIPIARNAESLNVAVAAGIALHQVAR